ncbi:MAG: HAMP domain-containing protein, partial [Coriobacteriia bacterium]|nr:HAMP domain-containing protein [Coriobacteriia bacterium]
MNPKNSSKNSSNRNTSRERSDHTIALQLLHKITRSVFATRLSFAFALIAAMTAIMVGVITYVTWSIAFEDYVRENVQEATDLTADDAEYFASQTEFLTEHDREMRSTTLLAISVAGLVAVSISVIIGGWYSDLLAAPIVQVTRAVRRMRDGDDDARVDLAGNDEIAQLGSTFNHMADTLAQRRRRERYMIDDLAHELRTPLMGIQATLEAIQDGVYPADSEHLQIVSDETMRLTGLTNALLELSMLEKYAEDFPLSRIDLNDPVRTSVAVSQARAQSLGLHIEMDLTDGLRVNADAARLQQAITNL